MYKITDIDACLRLDTKMIILRKLRGYEHCESIALILPENTVFEQIIGRGQKFIGFFLRIFSF